MQIHPWLPIINVIKKGDNQIERGTKGKDIKEKETYDNEEKDNDNVEEEKVEDKGEKTKDEADKQEAKREDDNEVKGTRYKEPQQTLIKQNLDD